MGPPLANGALCLSTMVNLALHINLRPEKNNYSLNFWLYVYSLARLFTKLAEMFVFSAEETYTNLSYYNFCAIRAKYITFSK